MARPGYCNVCSHPELQKIHAMVQSGQYLSQVVDFYKGDFSTAILRSHFTKCIGITGAELRNGQKLSIHDDVRNAFQYLFNEAMELYEVSKERLTVDGELSLDIRDYEVDVVYSLPIVTPDGKKIRINKKESLDTLIARLEEANPEHTYNKVILKSEDIRKAHRALIAQLESIIDRFAKIYGSYKIEADNDEAEIKRWVELCQRNAEKYGTTFNTELGATLELAGGQLKATIRQKLEDMFNSNTKQVMMISAADPEAELSK